MLTNPVLLSVVLMCVLCLLKVNVFLAIIIATIAAGLLGGIGLGDTMVLLSSGMGEEGETALSYVLLGALAVGISETGLASILANGIEKAFGKKVKMFLGLLAILAICSQNIIPVHIAFIPILVPPLLTMMNKMKLDRRAAACALAFGLVATYVMIPAGFGRIFQDLIADNLIKNGMDVDKTQVWKYLILPGSGMILGFLFAVFVTFRKPRDYEDKPLLTITPGTEGAGIVTDHFTKQHLGAALGGVSAFAIQIIFGSLPLGAVVGLFIMCAFGAVPFRHMDETMNGGVRVMGFIAFVMLISGGYANVIRESGGVDQIVQASVQLVGDNKALAAIIMLLIGLLIDMGIGTSFGTIPIIATVFVPFCAELGFSVPSTVILVGIAAALGDAGAPASDSTLGPTAGLNADGQHDHIWDTCVPTFLHYNIPLLIFGTIGALMLS